MRALLLWPMFAGVLAAQPDDELVLRARRLDSLAAVRWRELRALDRADVAAGRLHALHVDGIQLLVDSVAMSFANEGARRGLSDVGARGHDWMERVGAQLEIRIAPDQYQAGGVFALSVTATHRDNPALSAAVAVSRLDATGVRHAITGVFDRLLRNSIDQQLGLWLAADAPVSSVRQSSVSVVVSGGDNSLFGPAGPGAAAWEVAYTHIVRAPSAASRDCLAGSVPACARALGIGVAPSAPVTTWYAPEDFRWVSHLVSRDGDRPRQRSIAECDRGVVAACEQVVATTPPGRATAPLATADVRQGILLLALDLGGPEAIDRMLSSALPLPERLAFIAGVPVDSLISAWRARVVATPRAASPVSGVALAAGLLAAAALLALPRQRS